ncbi:putative transcription factor B3-Domain family [Helianthus annuus]|nr:putative transcription factor B3-Domain family [Helianthus annuus]
MPFITPKPTTAFSLQLSVTISFHKSIDFLNQVHVKIGLLHLLHLRLSFHPSISDFFSLIHIDIFYNMPGSSSLREPCFCRHMKKADEIILSIPSDVACKLWGVDMGPTNVDIHTDDGRIFNVCLTESKGNLFFFHGWSNVTQHLGLSKGCFIVFNPLDCTTFKLTHFIDGVSGSSFWTYLLRTSSHFYVIPEVILPETFSTSIDLISTIMINNNPFHVRIETDGGKFGFTVGIDVIVNVDVPLVPPIDAVNEIYEEPHSRVYRFSRIVGTDFMLPDRVSEMAKLNICLKDITVRLLNLEPPVQFTNGTRRERTHNGFRYALRRWSKFMKTAGIKDVVDDVSDMLLAIKEES